MKFGINQAISQTITQLSCIQLETPSSRLWNFWWIKTYTTFNLSIELSLIFNHHYLDWNIFINGYLTKCVNHRPLCLDDYYSDIHIYIYNAISYNDLYVYTYIYTYTVCKLSKFSIFPYKRFIEIVCSQLKPSSNTRDCLNIKICFNSIRYCRYS